MDEEDDVGEQEYKSNKVERVPGANSDEENLKNAKSYPEITTPRGGLQM
jgi:hypothetical protein